MKRSRYKIYVINNDINNRKYVGVTTYSLKHRFSGHCVAHLHTNIHEAIMKLGKENFTISLIRTCEEHEWKDLETYYIDLLDAHHNKGGYNLTYGGYDNPMSDAECISRHRKKMKSESHRKLQRELSTGRLHTEATKELCRKNTLANLDVCVAGFKKYNNSRKIRLAMLDSEGNILKEFDSASEACKFLDKPSTNSGNLVRFTDKFRKDGERARYCSYAWTRV